MEHRPSISKAITHKHEGVALRDHLIKGTYTLPGSKEEASFDIQIIKGKTKLSEIPDIFLETVKAEGLF